MRKSTIGDPKEMENRDDRVEEMNRNSQKFSFLSDNNQSQINLFKRQHDEKEQHAEIQQFDQILRCILETYEESSNLEKGLKLEKNLNEFQKQQQNTEQDKRSKKQQKAKFYSRKYREKNKEKMKILEEQNHFLKKKVDELQLRLREKEIQISRLKFTSSEQFDITQLNKQIITKMKIIQQHAAESNFGPKKQQHSFKETNHRLQQYLRMFDTYGFGGTKVKQIIEYYMNEFIENVMLDRQKYYFLNWAKKRYLNTQKTSFDLELDEVLKKTEDERKQSVQMAMKITPLTLDLLNACREMYRGYKNALKSLERIHELVREQLAKNIEYTQKKLKLVTWFQLNRYRKEMRELRAEWIDLVKSQDEPWANQKTATVKKKILK